MFRGVWVSSKGRKDVAVKQFKGISLPSDEMKELSFLQTCRSAELVALQSRLVIPGRTLAGSVQH